MSEVALFFEKMHKVFKNKAQGCSTPLSSLTCKLYHEYGHLLAPIKAAIITSSHLTPATPLEAEAPLKTAKLLEVEAPLEELKPELKPEKY